MLNLKKTKVLTKASLYENADGRTAIKLNNYCTEPSEIKRFIRSVPFGILLYLLLAIIITVSFPEWMESLHYSTGTTGFIILAAAAMIIFTALYCSVSYIIIRYRYQNVRSSLIKYRLQIRYLTKFYDDEEKNKAAKHEIAE